MRSGRVETTLLRLRPQQTAAQLVLFGERRGKAIASGGEHPGLHGVDERRRNDLPAGVDRQHLHDQRSPGELRERLAPSFLATAQR